eukprot:6674940-Heterocapsa_arctica.AAC.1
MKKVHGIWYSPAKVEKMGAKDVIYQIVHLNIDLVNTFDVYYTTGEFYDGCTKMVSGVAG